MRSDINPEASRQDGWKWTGVFLAPVRSLGRPLLHAWRHLYAATQKTVRDQFAPPSVTSHLMGGCGNQLFQYAAGLALARRLGVDLQLDISWYEAPTANHSRLYSLGLFKNIDARIVRTLAGKVIRENGLPYQPKLLETASQKCSLIGYWQCEKYFFHLREELLDRLLPRQPLPPRSSATRQAILAAGKRSVFVTVRRTDYVGSSHLALLPMSYYLEAAAHIAAKFSDPVFFVFSDEPEWCQANFKLPYETIVSGNFDRTVADHLGREDAELYLMRLCSHAIMANSSYSWWGAWLGADTKGGIVVAPKLWLGPAYNDDPRDIVPDRWIRL